MRRFARTARREGERGAAGAEALAFGALVLVAGTLVLVNVWGTIDARMALDAASREYLREYTQAPTHSDAVRRGELAARVALAARGTPISSLRVEHPDPARFGPCGEAHVALTATVPSMRVPFLGTLTRTEVTVQHRELVDAHREVEPHAAFDEVATLCAGS